MIESVLLRWSHFFSFGIKRPCSFWQISENPDELTLTEEERFEDLELWIKGEMAEDPTPPVKRHQSPPSISTNKESGNIKSSKESTGFTSQPSNRPALKQMCNCVVVPGSIPFRPPFCQAINGSLRIYSKIRMSLHNIHFDLSHAKDIH